MEGNVGFMNSTMSTKNKTPMLFQITPKNSTLSPKIGHFPCTKRLISMG
jgi:hypothetical protein